VLGDVTRALLRHGQAREGQVKKAAVADAQEAARKAQQELRDHVNAAGKK